MSDEPKDPLAQIEEFARRGRAAQQAVDALITPQASEAWQDVITERLRFLNQKYQALKPGTARARLAGEIAGTDWCCGLIAHARAADAQQIAALRATNEKLATGEVTFDSIDWKSRCHKLEQENALLGEWNIGYQKKCEQAAKIIAAFDSHVDELKAQLTALQAEIEQWKTWGVIEIAIRNVNVDSFMRHWEGRALKAEAQVEALQAEQAQWQQKAMRYLRHEPDCHISIARMTLFDPACHANGLCSCGLVQLAALTAQPDGSLPTRQPKP